MTKLQFNTMDCNLYICKKNKMQTGLIVVGIIIILLGGFIIVTIITYKKKMTNFDFSQHSQNLVILNDNTFQNKISGKIALVDFWAEWCQPCKIQSPIVNELADEYADNKKAAICSLNVEENKKIAAKYNVRNIPTIIIFKNGKEVARLVGLKPKAALKKTIENFIQ